MKMSKILSLLLVVVMLLSCFVACGGGKNNGGNNNGGQTGDNGGQTGDNGGDAPEVNPLAGTYDIVMWVSEKENEETGDSVVKQIQAQIDAFEAENPGIIINATISGVSEASAGAQVVKDVATAPDIYCFAQDQLASLVQAAALAAPGGAIADDIKASNDAGSVAAATVGGTLYAYPMTSDNGYYLYYDKSIVTNPESLEQIIADCEAATEAGKDHKTFRYALGDAWYTASFFFATGCHSEWTMNAEGQYTSVDDDFNSDAGLIAMKGMAKLAQSKAYDSDASIFTNAAAIVTGIWNAGTAQTHFGDNLGVTDLPSFTVDGNEYHLGSFSGFKLMGVKPQDDKTRGAVLQLLAHYLTSEKCQLERFNMWQWGPSNLKAQQSDAVKANPSLGALALQNSHENAHPQGQIEGSWWDIAKVLGADAAAAKSDEDLKAALAKYEAAVKGILNKSEEEKMQWAMIGYKGNWNTEYFLYAVEGEEGVWETDKAYEFAVGDEFKLRRGAAWDVQVGADGQMKTPDIEPANYTVEVAGKYFVRLKWDGVSTKATIEFIPEE